MGLGGGRYGVLPPELGDVPVYDAMAGGVLPRRRIVTPRGVYFLQAGEEGPVKIGRALDVGARIGALQSAHYEELALRLVYLPKNHGLSALLAVAEGAFHAAFSRSRIRGEWFAWEEVSGFVEDPESHEELLRAVSDCVDAARMDRRL